MAFIVISRTINTAKRYGRGAILEDTEGQRYRVSDWSPATGEVYGWPGERAVAGLYQKLPAVGLTYVRGGSDKPE